MIIVEISHKALDYLVYVKFLNCVPPILTLCTYTFIFIGYENNCIISFSNRYAHLLLILLTHSSFETAFCEVLTLPYKLISLAYFFLRVFQDVFNSSVASAKQLKNDEIYRYAEQFCITIRDLYSCIKKLLPSSGTLHFH